MSNPALQTVRALLLLARFDAAGFGYLGGRAQDVLASLAPLLAFPIVLALVAVIGSGDAGQLADLLAVVGVLLLPLVTSEALARRWQRDPAWGRFAVAFNWSQWTVMGVTAAVLLAANLAVAAGLPRHAAGAAALLAIAVYQFGLHWFLARRGLDLSRLRATLLVLAMDLSSSALVGLFLVLGHLAETPG